ncbi:MAG: hypothetical protein ACTSR2_04910 [Candidatus Hodarchaeales archaeon]
MLIKRKKYYIVFNIYVAELNDEVAFPVAYEKFVELKKKIDNVIMDDIVKKELEIYEEEKKELMKK